APRLVLDRAQITIGSPWLVMKQPEMAGAARGCEFGHLSPARMAPATMMWQFIGCEVRVRDHDRRVGAEVGKRGVDGAIAKLMIGRVHKIAHLTANPVRECPAWMVQGLDGDMKPANFNVLLTD